ncbi:MAG TPA: o-succinylbenzoate synthase, partial [Candidatus Hydrogenedentes bacterium]|nr:o-succinylbenzoate synthase [Candidatus Hydrogenedentota bacterium]
FHGLVEWLRAASSTPRIVISGAYESGVGMSALVHYAAAISGAEVAVGLDTYAALDADVLHRRLPLGDPELQVAALDGPIEVNPDVLEMVWEG